MVNKPGGNALHRKLLLFGGGGHCHSVLDSVIATGFYDDIGIVDYTDSSYLGIPVVGTDNDISLLKKDGWTAGFIAVGSVGDTKVRRRLFRLIQENELFLTTIIDPTAVIAKGTMISHGVYVGKKAIINTGATIGLCAIINTGAIIEHDSEVGAFTHVSPGVTICGQVTVGSDTHIGAGTAVIQGINIGDHVMIGAGSVVIKEITSNMTAYGNPCKVVK